MAGVAAAEPVAAVSAAITIRRITLASRSSRKLDAFAASALEAFRPLNRKASDRQRLGEFHITPLVAHTRLRGVGLFGRVWVCRNDEAADNGEPTAARLLGLRSAVSLDDQRLDRFHRRVRVGNLGGVRLAAVLATDPYLLVRCGELPQPLDRLGLSGS
jgi:hypothetical protein